MPDPVENLLRGPKAYDLAREAMGAMEKQRVWPTPLNYEIYLHCVEDPDGPLAQEIARLAAVGEPLTETIAEELAASYLPKARLNEQIRDAGDQLSKELEAVAKAITTAQKSSSNYGQTLADVSKELSTSDMPPALQTLVETLSSATRKVQRENLTLEKQLKESTSEVDRLREHLEQVRRDATTDALTNLANRKAFDDELERACAESVASGQPLTLAVIDIDHFKNFNDTWGHQTGDQVIRYVASVIGRMAPPPRFAARYGGEEFGLIFPGESRHGAQDARGNPRGSLFSHPAPALDQRGAGRRVGVGRLRRAASARKPPQPDGARRPGPLRFQALRPQPRQRRAASGQRSGLDPREFA
jgi:diguanylate cyclase